MNRQAALKKLLQARSVAVFGGENAGEVIDQCRAIGFDGEIWAVNPNRDELRGVPCLSSVAELPATPDASFIAAPPGATIEITQALSSMGSSGAVCFAAGFAESGDEGIERQQQLENAAGEMAIIGPNCHGFINYLDGLALWPDHHGGSRVDRGVALILQSGNIGINLSMQQRSLDLAYVVSVGNNISLGMHDYIHMLLDDPRVTAIGLHIEGIEDIHEFSVAAIHALEKGVPICVIKSGRSSIGAEITMSHTASLAGSDRLYEALFKRLGIIRCTTLNQFLETLKFVSLVGTLPGKKLGSLSCSGGEASLVADYAEGLGLQLPGLSEEASRELADVLGPRVHLANPLDYHTYAWGDLDKLSSCFTAMLRNGFDCTILVLDYPQLDNALVNNWEITEQALISAVKETGQRAVVVSSLPETFPLQARQRMRDAGIAPMQGIEDCLFAIHAAATMGLARKNSGSIQPVRKCAASTGHARMLNEWESKKELARHGLTLPAGQVCEQAGMVKAAEQIGYPLVLKGLSNEIAHKQKQGLVYLGIKNEQELQQASEQLSSRCTQFLLEKQVNPVVAEIIVGVSRDPVFGLTLLVGFGGTGVETLDDTVSLLLPVQRNDIAAAFRSLRLADLAFTSSAGRNDQQLESLVDAVEAILAYAMENEEYLEELDVNPLLLTPTEVIAVDALIKRSATVEQ